MNKIISSILFLVVFINSQICYAISKEGALVIYGDRETKLFDDISVYGDLSITLSSDIDWGLKDKEVGVYIENKGQDQFKIHNMLPKGVFIDDKFKVDSDCGVHGNILQGGKGCSFTFKGHLVSLQALNSKSYIDVSYGNNNKKNVKPWSMVLPLALQFDFNFDHSLTLRSVDSGYIKINEIYLVEGLVKHGTLLKEITNKKLLQFQIEDEDNVIESDEQFNVLVPAQSSENKVPLRTIIVNYGPEDGYRKFIEYLHFVDANYKDDSADSNTDVADNHGYDRADELNSTVDPNSGETDLNTDVIGDHDEEDTSSSNTDSGVDDSDDSIDNDVDSDANAYVDDNHSIDDLRKVIYIPIPDWLKIPDWVNYKAVATGTVIISTVTSFYLKYLYRRDIRSVGRGKWHAKKGFAKNPPRGILNWILRLLGR